MKRDLLIPLSCLILLPGCTKQSNTSAQPWWVWMLIVMGIIALIYLLWLIFQKPVEAAPQKPLRMAEPVAAPAQETTGSANLYDDLTRIEGIGPKINAVLQGAGITTYQLLADLDSEKIKEIITNAGIRLADTTTWPRQAQLASEGKMDELKKLQDSLKGGRIS